MNISKRIDSRNLYALSKPSSVVSEQFRIIRATLLRIAKEKDVKTILVTSSLPGEGKTFIASNLAANIAREVTEQVVLVDGDLRNPSIHKAFNLGDRKHGLYSLLIKDIRLNDLLCNTDIPNLSVLPSGNGIDNETKDISAKKIRDLINSIRTLYGKCYVVFDSGPVQLLADTLVMAEIVDGVALVVKLGYAKRSLVKKTVNLLGREKILGVILNYCELPFRGYHKYYR